MENTQNVLIRIYHELSIFSSRMNLESLSYSCRYSWKRRATLCYRLLLLHSNRARTTLSLKGCLLYFHRADDVLFAGAVVGVQCQKVEPKLDNPAFLALSMKRQHIKS